MPRLWEQSVEAHRRVVRDAILDTTAALAVEKGLRSVTMSEVAERAGIGRATLYKYFANVETILLAWHERQVCAHAHELRELAHRHGPPVERLEAVLTTLGLIYAEHHGSELAALLHHGPHVIEAEQHLASTLHALINEALASGASHDDLPVEEQVAFCTHALAAASSLPSSAAVHRLVAMILAGLGATVSTSAPSPPLAERLTKQPG